MDVKTWYIERMKSYSANVQLESCHQCQWGQNLSPNMLRAFSEIYSNQLSKLNKAHQNLKRNAAEDPESIYFSNIITSKVENL